ncbi:hypothetical protein SAMN05216259_101646 [Actinacidiphila guanduensis]|uniref:Uncharacterized protein n=1 Tax=Actinacidiphila guanduensis TaxID=310781 RepID=A0A1G9WHC7_9ACTN|nr:hypothetical protein SAMN05216259_101646 [Actinacidiphila guanduensis]
MVFRDPRLLGDDYALGEVQDGLGSLFLVLDSVTDEAVGKTRDGRDTPSERRAVCPVAAPWVTDRSGREQSESRPAAG